LHTATGTYRIKHFTGSPAAEAATVATTTATTVAATTATTTATGLFRGITAGLTLFRLLKTFGEVKFLFFPCEDKVSTTSGTDDLLIFH
jgi:hypothetical protein